MRLAHRIRIRQPYALTSLSLLFLPTKVCSLNIVREADVGNTRTESGSWGS